MKIVQIVTQMEAGGAQRVAYLLHRGFCEKGYDSELWFLYTKRPFYEGLDGVHSLLNRPPSALDYLAITNRLYRKLRDGRPDALITHTHYSNLLGHLVAALAGVPNRIAVHHNPLPTYPRAARIADRLFGAAGLYSSMVAVSASVVKTMHSYPKSYSRLVKRIYNGVPIVPPAPKDIRSTWSIPANKPLLVSVGRLSIQKNQDTLLNALIRVPDAHLALIGDGDQASALKAQARSLGLSDRVHFAGEIPSEDVSAFLQAADIFVFPSRWESMGLAVLEAMQAGLPIVASDIPAMREVLGDSGLLVPLEDAAALAQAILRVLQDPELSSRLRLSGAHRTKLFSAETMVSEYQQLLAAPSLDSTFTTARG